MRCIAVWIACLALAAGEAPLPASTQKLVDDSTAAVGKSKQTYDQAVAKEQAKLAAALAKEQERETKKGNLDGALAIKSLILEVQGGLLQKQTEASGDLLGDSAATTNASTTVAPPAELMTDSKLPSGPAQPSNTPAQLTEFMQRTTAMRLPKGDATPLNFGATTAGMVAVYNGGGGRNAELWAALLKAGFHRVEEGNNQWFVLNAKPGDRFTVFDPPGTSAQIEVYAARFKTAR